MKDWAPKTKWLTGIVGTVLGSLLIYGINDVLATRKAALADHEQAQLERRLQQTTLAKQLREMHAACDRVEALEERVGVIEAWKTEGGPRFGRADGEGLRVHLEGEISALTRELAALKVEVAQLRARMPP